MPSIYIMIALVLFAMGFGSGKTWESNANDAQLLIAKKTVEKASKVKATSSVGIEDKAAKVKIKFKTEYRVKYVEKIRYIDRRNTCKLSANVMQLWQSSIDAATTKANFTDPALPEPSSIK